MLTAQASSYLVILLLGLPGLIQIQRRGLSLRHLDRAATEPGP
jgi:hypothetical protein